MVGEVNVQVSVMQKVRNMGTMLLGMLIFYQIVLNSQWDILYQGSIWKLTGYFLYAVLVCFLVISFWQVKLQMKQLIALIGLLAVGGIYLILGNLSVAIVFIFGAFALFLNVRDVLNAYFKATGLGILTVVIMALAGLLPMYDKINEFWLIGFKNPNILGYYLLLTVVLLFVRDWNQISWLHFMFWLGAVVFDLWVLDDKTATMGLLLLALLWLVLRKAGFIKQRLFNYAIVVTPLLLTGAAYAIGFAWGRVNFIYRLNDIFTSRPVIWNYYMGNYPLKLLRGSLPKTLTFARGALDGAYVYYPYSNGLLVSIILIVLLISSLYYLVRQARWDLVSMQLILLVVAFSENAPFFVFQSPLLVLAIMVGMFGVNHGVTVPPLEQDHQRQEIL